ncbi:DUF1642 domain-containing protein [Enterococcus thailandicus]|uniref:DUF1642 domain-containing protein n=1 Tax=Enterococcus thailandicus TaxID=417368 RepID=UPI0034DD1C88
MKFLDLFGGIGGFRLGMESAGHECVGFCEIDKFARASYKAIHNTENEVEMHDITTVLCDALRYGYEVEKEPLYYIKLFVPTNPVVGLYLGFNTEGKFDHSYGKPHITWGWKYTFTEAEIKAIDERYWAFAVPVDEVEEG